MTKMHKIEALERLLGIMATLRAPGGCPWDASQTPESLKRYLLEETYEVLEAIDTGEPASVCDELGDLLLQIVFHSCIFEERGDFHMGDVAKAISDKLVRRHPHVFGTATDLTPELLGLQWDRIKEEENTASKSRKRPLERIPSALPALLRARKVVEKSGHLCEELRKPDLLLAQIEEDLQAMKRAAEEIEPPEMQIGLGRLLFSLVRFGDALHIDAEDSLRQATDSFIGQCLGIDVPGDRVFRTDPPSEMGPPVETKDHWRNKT